MNPFLIILVLATISVVIISLVYTREAQRNTLGEKTLTITNATPDCVPNINNDLANISSNNQCCLQGGQLTASRYVTNIKNSGLNVVVNPIITPYLTACQGYCDSLTDAGVCVGTTQQQANFAACLGVTMPKTCSAPSLAIAHDGTTLFYVQSVTDASCKVTALCSNAGSVL